MVALNPVNGVRTSYIPIYKQFVRDEMKDRQIGIGHITAAARQRLEALGVDPVCALLDHVAGRWGAAVFHCADHNRRCDAQGYGGWIQAVQLDAAEYVIVVTNVTADARQRQTWIFLSSEQTPDITGRGF